MLTTRLYEKAREVCLEYLGLNKARYSLIFCSPARAKNLTAFLHPEKFTIISSNEIGLPLGIRAVAVERDSLPKGIPFESGGGTARLFARDWVLWAKEPDKFEAGTPMIINAIAFARALQLIQEHGKDIFLKTEGEKITINDILYRDDLERLRGNELLSELRKTLIDKEVVVPIQTGEVPYIHLDNAASTPTFKTVWAAVEFAWKLSLLNQNELIDEVRSICAGFLGAGREKFEIIFTSNTTESINLLTHIIGSEQDKETEPVILTTLLEHSSNDLPWRWVDHHSQDSISIDEDGFLNFKELENKLIEYNNLHQHGKKRIKLLAVSAASNVLGTCNNLAEISRLVHKYEARLMVDAAQIIAHRKVDMESIGIDYLVFSAHKVYAPFGTGVLVARKEMICTDSKSLSRIHASGEENIGGIAALGKSLLLLERIGLDIIHSEENILTERLLRGLSRIEKIKVHGIRDPEQGSFAYKLGVIPFVIKGMNPAHIAKAMAEEGGIGVRYGCHCAHILVKRIVGVGPRLEKFQRLVLKLFKSLQLPGVVRISIGIENTMDEMDHCIRILENIALKETGKRSRKDANTLEEKSLRFRKDIRQRNKDFLDLKSWMVLK